MNLLELLSREDTLIILENDLFVSDMIDQRFLKHCNLLVLLNIAGTIWWLHLRSALLERDIRPLIHQPDEIFRQVDAKFSVCSICSFLQRHPSLSS